MINIIIIYRLWSDFPPLLQAAEQKPQRMLPPIRRVNSLHHRRRAWHNTWIDAPTTLLQPHSIVIFSTDKEKFAFNVYSNTFLWRVVTPTHKTILQWSCQSSFSKQELNIRAIMRLLCLQNPSNIKRVALQWLRQACSSLSAGAICSQTKNKK